MDHGGVRWLVLDTLDAGRHGGMICEDRAAWLKRRLRERKDVPTIIVLHHPPVDTGIDWMSALSCETWVKRLEAVVRPAKQVVGMIAGHVHRPIATSFAGKQLSICSSAAPWVALDLEDIDPKDPAGLCAALLERRASVDPFRRGRAAPGTGQLRHDIDADDPRLPEGTRDRLGPSGNCRRRPGA
jgi:hypothetical protein